MRTKMPIQGGEFLKAVPWVIVECCEDRAKYNHGQSLDTLASRSGMSPFEMLKINKDEPLFPIDKGNKDSELELIEILHENMDLIRSRL